MDDVIFQASDLVQRRVEVLDAAKAGRARVRDRDGTSLVMLPEHRLVLLEKLAQWNASHLLLEDHIRRGVLPSVAVLGGLSWLRSFDLDDLREFVLELHEALVASYADNSLDVLDACVQAWMVTSRQLEDPMRRAVLLRGSLAASDLVEASRPDAS